MGVPGNANALLLRSAAAAGGYQVSRSLRFNSADSAYLSRTPASAGNRKTWTWSGWIKLGKLGNWGGLFKAGDSDMNPGTHFILYEDGLEYTTYNGSVEGRIITSQVFRDPSAWYHLVLAIDTTSGTANNRQRLWVNGSEVTTFSSRTNHSPSADTYVNDNTYAHEIGRTNQLGVSNFKYFDGYMADIWFLDGIAATPSDFAETDATTGQWIPKTYSGSKGSNGFHLEFADNSNNTATTLGKDTSGNGNNWTPNNLSNGIGNGRYLSTVSTNNGSFTAGQEAYFGFDGNTGTFCSAATAGNSGGYMDINVPAWNRTGSVEILANTQVYYSVNGATAVALGASWTNVGNAQSITTLRLTRPGTSNTPGFYAIRVNSVELIDYAADSGNDCTVDTPTSYGTDDSLGGSVRGNYCTWNPLDKGSTISFVNGNLDLSSSGAAWNSGKGSIGVSSGKYYWEITVNTSLSGDPQVMLGIGNLLLATSGNVGSSSNSALYDSYSGKKYPANSSYGATYSLNDVIGVALDMDGGTLTFYKNGVSQGQSHTGLTGTWFPWAMVYGTASLTANFGQRAFAYTAPSGFKALCDTNLTAPVIAKPNTVMDVALYTGTGSSNARTVGFSPDLVWIKPRSNANPHQLFDRVRGDNVRLKSNSTEAEYTYSAGVGLSFDSSGFTVGTDNGLNESGQTFVGWCFDGGTSTVSNTQGSITSSVRANASAGFSIVTYTSSSSVSTVGHGLGVAPYLIITKNRSVSNAWWTYHNAIGNTKAIRLDATDAQTTMSSTWNNTSPTSTVFTVGGEWGNGNNIVAYCFAPVAGYSSFGSYTGNGSSDGPAIWLGFRPALLIIKNSSATNNWVIFDSKRDGYNVNNDQLYPNTSAAEDDGLTYTFVDLLSNGFKLRNTATDKNGSGGTYIYCAWAESPFQYARAR